MTKRSSAGMAAAALLVGALACAGTGLPKDETGAAPDTSGTQNPPGYRGMERDTTQLPDSQPTASDTFLQDQGTGVPEDTAGYSGIEHPDTSGAAVRIPAGRSFRIPAARLSRIPAGPPSRIPAG